MSTGLRAILLATTATVFAFPAIAAVSAAPRAPLVADHAIAVAYNSVVAGIQAELNRNGYDAGPVDGLIGDRTRNAIADYQRNRRLLVTGEPSQSLLDHLRTGAAPAPAPVETPQATSNTDSQEIVQLQRRLGRLGYTVEESGRVDAATRAAIRKYQRDHNLLVTGETSDALIAHIRASVRAERDDRSDRRDAAVDAGTLADIQRGLRERGYTVGNVSGALDDTTRTAIRAYQRDRGDAVTGEPSDALAEQLGEGLAPSLATRANIRRVQQALNERGYNAGPADGVMGPATRSAINTYRQRAGLGASTEISEKLLESLDIDSETAAAGATRGAAGADAGAKVLVVRDDFSDGDFVNNPSWQVLAQDFRVASGALTSTVAAPVQPSNEDVGKDLLKGVLGEVLGVQVPSRSNTGAIALGTRPFDAPFNMRVRLRETADGAVRMHIGSYVGTNASNGYRVVYDSSAARPLAIVAGLENSTETVASTAQAPALDDGAWHDLLFSRDAEGHMSVAIDGAVALAGEDRRIGGSQNGISFMNAAGSWEIDTVEVTTEVR
jgi:peptidoglycan hydrolase-like protein with peptidoglycan-binding domain